MYDYGDEAVLKNKAVQCGIFIYTVDVLQTTLKELLYKLYYTYLTFGGALSQQITCAHLQQCILASGVK